MIQSVLIRNYAVQYRDTRPGSNRTFKALEQPYARSNHILRVIHTHVQPQPPFRYPTPRGKLEQFWRRSLSRDQKITSRNFPASAPDVLSFSFNSPTSLLMWFTADYLSDVKTLGFPTTCLVWVCIPRLGNKANSGCSLESDRWLCSIFLHRAWVAEESTTDNQGMGI